MSVIKFYNNLRLNNAFLALHLGVLVWEGLQSFGVFYLLHFVSPGDSMFHFLLVVVACCSIPIWLTFREFFEIK